MAAHIVASALAQEGVSRASSYISAKLDENASTAHNMARLEMALSRLEFGLERAGKMPITCISLLRRMKILKRAHGEGTGLLNKHYRPVLQHKELVTMEDHATTTGRAVKRNLFFEWIWGRAKRLRVSYLLGLTSEAHLSLRSASVEIFEWYADYADKFVADVESACPLGRGTFLYPFVRQLLEGKTLWYSSTRGSQLMGFHMAPLRSDADRGVEAQLWYKYKDLRNTQSGFDVALTLRLSESTDIVGTLINCMKLLTSQLKLVVESAIGELTLLPDLQDVSHCYAPHVSSTHCANKLYRPDPVCCSGNGPRDLANSSIISVESSNQVLESVIAIGFACCIAAPEYMTMHNKNAPAPPLSLNATCFPHLPFESQPEIRLEYRDKEERRSGGMEQVEEMVRSTEATDCCISLVSDHGAARIILRKSCNEKAGTKPTPAPRRGRSAAKRKR